MNNPLLDKVFLSELDQCREKEIWAKVIALDLKENPTEEITGRITGGSINIDGSSAVRRSCSVSMVAKDLNINSFYWGLHSKFKLFIGLTNKINTKYPDIIWFPQGIYLITNFSTSHGVNSYNISIQGKDKMCLLNGEIGGTLTAPIDFGKEEYVDEEGNLTITDIPIKKIILEGVHEYAKEPWHNIIINDLEELGIELLEYRSSRPLYMIINENTGEVVNMTLDKEFSFSSGKTIKEIEKEGILNKLNSFYIGVSSGYYVGSIEGYPKCSVAKIDYGQTAGYRLTDLIYAGNLISNQGEPFTSMLDKLVKMLGEFEYFYDLDGHFVFQRKKIYVQQNWNNLIKTDTEDIISDVEATPFAYEFKSGLLTTSFSNNPNLTGLKNDFSIWGSRKTTSGSEIPIHLRYAIDKKPTKYTSFAISKDEAEDYNNIFAPKKPLMPREAKTYLAEEHDWRELIYQMAKDYRKFNHWEPFLTKVRDANIIDDEYLYPDGYTGYEQYYIDMEGFWRQLYNPDYKTDDPSLGGDGPIETPIEVNENGMFTEASIKDIFVYPFKKIEDKKEIKKDKDGNEIFDENDKPIYLYNANNTYIIKQKDDRYEVKPFIDKEYCGLTDKDSDFKFYKYFNYEKEPTPMEFDLAKKSIISTLYIDNPDYDEKNEKYIKWIDYKFDKTEMLLYTKSEENKKLTEIESDTDDLIKGLYFYKGKNGESCVWPYYFKEVFRVKEGEEITEETPRYYEMSKIDYYYTTYNYIEPEYDQDNNLINKDKAYWNKNIWDAPELLNFWFDFMDTFENAEMNKYAVSAVGNRPKVINDTNIKAIYFRETPTVIFYNKNGNLGWGHEEKKSGYTYIQIPDSMLSLFNISSQGKSAQTLLEESLNNDTYCIESVSMNTIPIYYLQPNTRIYIRNDESNIDSEYIVSRFTIPLNYNGTMSISATKIADRIY